MCNTSFPYGFGQRNPFLKLILRYQDALVPKSKFRIIWWQKLTKIFYRISTAKLDAHKSTLPNVNTYIDKSFGSSIHDVGLSYYSSKVFDKGFFCLSCYISCYPSISLMLKIIRAAAVKRALYSCVINYQIDFCCIVMHKSLKMVKHKSV